MTGRVGTPAWVRRADDCRDTLAAPGSNLIAGCGIRARAVRLRVCRQLSPSTQRRRRAAPRRQHFPDDLARVARGDADHRRRRSAPKIFVDAASDRVTVTGWVDDPSIYLAGAKVVLVPLRQGGGLRVKMLEACAAGKAIVASPMAIEGLSLRHDEEVRIAKSDGEFAASAVALMADPEARARLELASRRWWEDEHDIGRWSAQYADLYASLGKSG